jgi:sulfate-transporting ATPase
VPAPGGTHNAARATGRELRVRDLTVRYGGVLAVDGLSLSVRPGQVVGLIGPNGAGKTTVLDAITGFIRPSAGTVTLDDTDLSHLRTDQRSAAGVARSFQALELFEDMTVRENLLVAVDPQDWTAYVKDLIGPRAPRLTPGAVSAVEEFDLLERLDVLPTELSYGQRRLVAVARAVAAEPAVLLLDEPAAGLDAGSRTELGHLIRRLAEVRGIGVLLIEHDVELVMSVCDHVVVLDFGCSIASGSPAEVRSDERVITAYVGASAQGPAVPVPPSPGGIGD